MHCYHCDKDSAAKGETAQGMRKEMTNPIQARWCQAGWFWRLWWCLWVTEPDNGHRSWCTHDHCKPTCSTQHKSNTTDCCTTNFFYFLGFLEEKLCAVLTSAWDRGHTQREESLQTGPSVLSNFSLLAMINKTCYCLAKKRLFERQNFRTKFSVEIDCKSDSKPTCPPALPPKTRQSPWD